MLLLPAPGHHTSSTIALCKEIMPKPMSKLGIMNAMGDAAHKKSRMLANPDPDNDGDVDGDPEASNPKAKQAAAIGAKKKAKGNVPAPKIPKSS